MKLMKWMTVTALATATVFGSFVESVEAVHFFGSGGGFSYRGFDDTRIDEIFFLSSETPDGESISDEDRDPLNSKGFFSGAVENFYTYGSSFGRPNVSLRFDEKTGFPLNPDFPESSNERLIVPDDDDVVEDADFQAQLIQKDNIFDELGFIVTDAFTGESVIVYSILKDDVVLARSFVFPGDGEPSSFSTFKNFDPISATNSLEYILSQNVLDRSWREGEARNILEFGESFNEDGFLRSEFIDIPESNMTASLLGLGVVGIGLGLKRKLK